jgi:hypothetical protein
VLIPFASRSNTIGETVAPDADWSGKDSNLDPPYFQNTSHEDVLKTRGILPFKLFSH